MIHYIGMDCHRKTIRACRRNSAGEIVDEVDIAGTHEAIAAYAKEHLTKEDVVALESSFYSRSIARALIPLVARVVISNPLLTKAIAYSKKKTDKVDARVLSDLLRLDYLPQVWLPDAETEIRRDLCAMRASLVSERTRIKNRIHSVLAAALIPVEVSDLFGKSGLAWLAALPLKEEPRSAIESDQRLLEVIDTEIEAVEDRLAKNGWNEPRVRLLMTLPGVSIAVAQTVLAAIGDVDRFTTPDQFASYLGLVPSVHQSGEHCYHGPITRRGNGKARWMLIQAAQHIALHPGPLGQSFRRLLKRKNRNVAVCACARKLAVIAWHMLKKNEPYRYAQPLPTENKLSKLRVAATDDRRKTGPKKGTPAAASRGTGTRTRTTPGLPAVYEREGLPPATPPSKMRAAEIRYVNEMGANQYVEEIQSSKTRKQTHSRPGRPECEKTLTNSIATETPTSMKPT